MESLVRPARTSGAPPYQRLDSVWMSRVRRSGWQGWTLLAGGPDVMDQSILFWQEGKGSSRCLCLTLRVRQATDAVVRERLTHMAGHDVYRGSVPYPRKQVVAGEVHPLDRQWALMAGSALDVALDSNLRVRYLPYENAEATPYSTQGCLTVTFDGARGQIDEVTTMLVALSQKLGIDTRRSSAVDLELLYLRKMAWARRLDLDAFDALLSPTENVDERLRRLRAFVSEALGVPDVTALEGYDWQPHFDSAYNPWTSATGTGEAGWPHWHRFDIEPALRTPLGQMFLGHDLAAHAPNVGDRVARIIRSTGHLLSAEERWMRLGTPSASINMPHGQWGGGTYLPLRLLDDPRGATLVFNIGLLARVDHIAMRAAPTAAEIDGGRLGGVTHALTPLTLSDRLGLDELAAARPCDVYFKRAVSFMDSLVRINLDHDVDRARVLEAFRVVGVTAVRGVDVSDVVCLNTRQ